MALPKCHLHYRTSRAAGGTVRWMLLVAVSLVPPAWSAGVASGRDHASGAPLVTTAEGPVRGFRRDGINIFQGIPYAAPPVGELRWRPPRPVHHWAEPLDASHYGATCPQVTTLATFAGPGSVNENCLFLNVFTQGIPEAGAARPVIVWIHGGGNIDGESNDYDGSALAAGGRNGVQTIVVTFNYRLGLFGTFSHSAIDGEGHFSGNYATLDQQAVLRWVQRNIAFFGGDRHRVTLAGQSAGANATAANLLSPLAQGLFHRAILQSSPAYPYVWPTSQETRAKGQAFADAAGCPGNDASAARCLRLLSPARILQLSGTASAASTLVTWTPIVDGMIVPMQPKEAWAGGQFHKMPLMGGSTRDETTFLSGIEEYFSNWPHQPMSAAQYADAVKPGAFCFSCRGQSMPAGAASRYALSRYGGDPMSAYVRLTTDLEKCVELQVLRDWAPLTPTYAYDFTYANAPFYLPTMPGFKAGAAHTADIQFLFRGFHGGAFGVNLDQSTGLPRGLTAQETTLSNQMLAAWTDFAATGNPNGDGAPVWPRFVDNPAATFLQQDIPLSTETIARFRAYYQCDFWDLQLP